MKRVGQCSFPIYALNHFGEALCMEYETPKTWFSGRAQTSLRQASAHLLPSGLYRRPRSFTGSCLPALQVGSWAIPPVGNFTLPRRCLYMVLAWIVTQHRVHRKILDINYGA